MRHEWTDKDGNLWYAKDGTIWGAEFGQIESPGVEEEIEEGDVGASAPLPEPALEILLLAARVRELEAEQQSRVAALAEHNVAVRAEERARIRRLVLGEADRIDRAAGTLPVADRPPLNAAAICFMRADALRDFAALLGE